MDFRELSSPCLVETLVYRWRLICSPLGSYAFWIRENWSNEKKVVQTSAICPRIKSGIPARQVLAAGSRVRDCRTCWRGVSNGNDQSPRHHSVFCLARIARVVGQDVRKQTGRVGELSWKQLLAWQKTKKVSETCALWNFSIDHCLVWWLLQDSNL